MKRLIYIILLLVCFTSATYAQLDLQKKLDLTFNTSIDRVFQILERELDINIILDNSVRNQGVNFSARDMSAENVFKLLFQMYNLDYKTIDNRTVLIFPSTKASDYNAEITRVFELKYTDAQIFAGILRGGLGISQAYVNPIANNITVKTSRAKIKEIEEIIEQLEGRENYFDEIIEFSYIDAEKAIEIISEMSKISASIVDGDRNRIGIRGRHEDLEEIRRLAEEIDTQSPQVVIDVTILDVSEGFQEEIGFDFNSNFELNSDTSASILYKIINPQLLTLTKNSQSAEILSNPSIMAVNREEASINIGERVPIITARDLGESSGGYDVVPEVEYVDVGILLQITPDIHQDGEVSIKVGLEVSSIGSYVESEYGVYPTFLSKNIDTMIRLKDGEGVAFGGLISSEERDMISSIPFFENLPIIGNLLGRRKSEPKKSEVIMFISPKLIYPESEGEHDVL